MPQVTALRELRGGRIAVELDGTPWRSLPPAVVVHAGLAVGVELDRPRLRSLRRHLRRHEALAEAAQALRYRDLSRRRLQERLARKGVAPAARDETIGLLERAGVLEDERFGATRAGVLARKGLGDAAIADDLERQGLSADLIERALEELEPELDRARRLVEARGAGPARARDLLRRGFAEETIEAVLPPDVANGA